LEGKSSKYSLIKYSLPYMNSTITGVIITLIIQICCSELVVLKQDISKHGIPTKRRRSAVLKLLRYLVYYSIDKCESSTGLDFILQQFSRVLSYRYSRDGSVVWRWATGWTIGVLGFDSRWALGIFLFTTVSRTALGPTQPPMQWVPGALSLGVKRPGSETDHSPASSVEVKE
jgi:hypothetical protein